MKLCFTWLALVTALMSGCGRTDTEARRFDFQGTVVAVAANKRSITIAHHEIAGYMDAMTMPFPVRESSLLQGLGEGDFVQGQITVTPKDGWLSELKLVKKGESLKTQDRSKPVPIQHLLQPGEDLPDVLLKDQDGKTLRPADFQGQILVISFIFTRCPFPNFCPWTTSRLKEIQHQLQMRNPQLFDRTHFVSVSIDPQFDTPAILREYGARYNADAKRWSFTTGEPDEIARFASHLGCSFWSDSTGSSLPTHNLVTAIVRPDDCD